VRFRLPFAPFGFRAGGKASRVNRTPLLTVWGAWLVVMAGANLATPLYAVYAERFGFSSLVLTAIFAAYGFVLVPALLVFGRLSDRFGRRPVLLAGLLVAAAGLAVFATARGTGWLFGARALQGLAVGLISGPATAALVEFDRRRAEQRPALLAGLAQAGGSGAGAAVAGLLAEWAPAPRQLSYLLLLALTLVAAAVVLRLPEPAGRSGEPWRIERPRVPGEIREDFLRVAVTAATSWGALALFLSIVPKYAGQLLGTHNLALLAAVGVLALAASCATQIVSQRRRLPVRLGSAAGLGLLALGLVGLAASAPLHSLAVLLAAAVAAGAGHGFGYLGAQDELNTIAPAKRRGEVTSAFVGCIYLVVSAAVIASGLLDEWLSLTNAVGIVALVLGAVAGGGGAWQARVVRDRRSGAARSPSAAGRSRSSDTRRRAA
jgi:MFS family permease